MKGVFIALQAWPSPRTLEAPRRGAQVPSEREERLLVIEARQLVGPHPALVALNLWAKGADAHFLAVL